MRSIRCSSSMRDCSALLRTSSIPPPRTRSHLICRSSRRSTKERPTSILTTSWMATLPHRLSFAITFNSRTSRGLRTRMRKRYIIMNAVLKQHRRNNHFRHRRRRIRRRRRRRWEDWTECTRCSTVIRKYPSTLAAPSRIATRQSRSTACPSENREKEEKDRNCSSWRTWLRSIGRSSLTTHLNTSRSARSSTTTSSTTCRSSVASSNRAASSTTPSYPKLAIYGSR